MFLMDRSKELEGKQTHDPLLANMTTKSKTATTTLAATAATTTTTILIKAPPIIVGAGPSGLATAACLKEKGVPSLILEKANCIASLWQHRTYDRLRLHLPKQYCELPLMSFPKNFPTYPTKQQFLAYLEAYVKHFDLNPQFNERVVSAEYDRASESWRVKALGLKGIEIEYVSQWLIVASGENAEAYVPRFEGMEDFGGEILHTSSYRSGEMLRGKRVLVVGCGNSGMEVCLDLCNYSARPFLVVRDSVHVLPQKMIGWSTFGVSMWLLKWFPLRLVDQFLLLISYFMLGDTAKYGLNRPKIGPLELKKKSGKTPVLDVGTLSSIRRGDIKVCRGVRRVRRYTVEFVDGEVENFDAIILATGYKSNVPSWLKDKSLFSEESGFPRKPFPNGWRGENGLYAVGFSKRGLLGASIDAKRISQDIRATLDRADEDMKF